MYRWKSTRVKCYTYALYQNTFYYCNLSLLMLTEISLTESVAASFSPLSTLYFLKVNHKLQSTYKREDFYTLPHN
jgi:hypothetical protein